MTGLKSVTVAAVGDVSTGFDPPDSAFSYVMKPLRSADIKFAQVERVYSERGSFQQQSGALHSRQHPRMAAAFKTVPFDVVSIASNHSGDWGPEAIEDTQKTFRLLDIGTIGAGVNISDARKPLVISRKKLRIVFLGYVSTTLPQYWATEGRAGSVPMRAHTFYEPYEFQPGAPPRVITIPHEGDLEELVQDVRAAKKIADVVLVSLHWGVHFVVRPCDYQPMVGHAAIDAGADAVIGHHAHQPQAIERYKSGVIFYSLGNFCFYRTAAHKRNSPRCAPNREYTFQEVYSLEPEPGVVYDYQRHYNEGGIAFLEFDKDGLAAAEYLPTFMRESGHAEVVGPDSPQFQKSLAYLNWAGKFVKGGMTNILAVGDRYQIYRREG
ncbi:MAG: CapA family protein [Betaproteobacteria bacterium]|nr:CapA family protein [Betaproteobacteria bacterium]